MHVHQGKICYCVYILVSGSALQILTINHRNLTNTYYIMNVMFLEHRYCIPPEVAPSEVTLFDARRGCYQGSSEGLQLQEREGGQK